jgi:hypothetical protein
MLTIHDEPTQDDYLNAIRAHVCSRCVERPPGGPPCLPLGKICGIELHLPELLAAIKKVESPSVEPYLERTHEEVCARCAHLGGAACPCPMDTLMVRLVDAVEAVDAEFQRRDLERELEEVGGGD